MTEQPIAAHLGIDTAEIERGFFLGRPISSLVRTDLLAIIGWFARKDAMMAKISDVDRPPY